MIRSCFVTSLLALGAITIQVRSAEAALFTLNPGDSVSGSFTSPAPGQAACATCSASVTFGLSADGLILTVTLTNTSTDGLSGINTLTAFGFDSSPDLVITEKNNGPTPNVANVALSGGWFDNWEVKEKGAGLNYEMNASSKNGVNSGLDGGQSGTATFTFFDPLTFLTIDASRIHIQQIPTGGSTKFDCCTFQGQGDPLQGQGQPQQGSPEPASLLLFGFGSLAMASRLRRRA